MPTDSSTNKGKSWKPEALVHDGSSEYSSMVRLDEGGRIGIAFVADDRSKIMFREIDTGDGR